MDRQTSASAAAGTTMEATALTGSAMAPTLEQLHAVCNAQPGARRLGERDCEEIYTQGWTLFQRGDYAKAAERFALLNLYRPLAPRYLNAHAMCHKLLHNFEMAATLFFAALTFDEDNPQPALNLAQCLFALQRDDLAQDALALVVARAGGDIEHAALRATAERWMTQQQGERRE